MSERSRISAFVMATFGVLPGLAGVFVSRIVRHTAVGSELDPGAIAIVFLILTPVLAFLASRYIYSRFTASGYYGISGVVRWLSVGALIALVYYIASSYLPLPDREDTLFSYLLLRIADYVILYLALVVSFRIAFHGVEKNV